MEINSKSVKLSVCVPAYNRSEYLSELLDSIISQGHKAFEIIICEDMSPQRKQIKDICTNEKYSNIPGLRYIENEENLGYDANIRKLISLARGDYIFFMGNDDLMCPDALETVSRLINTHENVGMVLKSYAWFDGDANKINQSVRFFSEVRYFEAGHDAIVVGYRRSGVISGYIVNTAAAQSCSTSEFDGGLYYQMHVTASVLKNSSLVSCPEVLVLCRNGVPPDFGHSASEASTFRPGVYTVDARLKMISSAMEIITKFDERNNLNTKGAILRDYSNYFYPYIKDQLNLPLSEYLRLCRGYAGLGFGKYPMFYIYTTLCYLVKERRFDSITRFIRGILGRSPQFGISGGGKK